MHTGDLQRHTCFDKDYPSVATINNISITNDKEDQKWYMIYQDRLWSCIISHFSLSLLFNW